VNINDYSELTEKSTLTTATQKQSKKHSLLWMAKNSREWQLFFTGFVFLSGQQLQKHRQWGTNPSCHRQHAACRLYIMHPGITPM